MTLQLSPYTQAALADGTRSFLAKRLLSKHPQPILQALASTPALLTSFKGEFTPELLLDAGPLHSPDIAALVECEHETLAASVFLPLPDALVGRVASFLDARTALRLPLLCHHAYALRCEVLCPLAHAVLEMTPRIHPAVAELSDMPPLHPDSTEHDDPLRAFAPCQPRTKASSIVAQLVQCGGGRHHDHVQHDRRYSEDSGESEDDVPRPQSLQCLERLPMASIVRGTVMLATLSTLVMHMDEELLDMLQTSSFMDSAIKHITNLVRLLVTFDKRVRVHVQPAANHLLCSLLRANSHSLRSFIITGGQGLWLSNIHFSQLASMKFINCPDLHLQDISWPSLRVLIVWNSWLANDRTDGSEEPGQEVVATGLGSCFAEVENLQTASLGYNAPLTENRQQLLSILHSINRGVSDRRRRVLDQLDGPLLWSPRNLYVFSYADPVKVAQHLDLRHLLERHRNEQQRNEQQAALQPLWVDHHIGLLTEVLQNVAPQNFQFDLTPHKMVRTLQSFEAMCNFISRLPDILAAAVAKNPHLLPPIQPGTKPMPGQGLREFKIKHRACLAAADGREDEVSEAGSDESGSDVEVQYTRRGRERYRIGKRITRQQKDRAVAGVRERIADVLRDKYDMHMEYVPGCCNRHHVDVWRLIRYKAPSYRDVLMGTRPAIPASQLPGRKTKNTCTHCSARR